MTNLIYNSSMTVEEFLSLNEHLLEPEVTAIIKKSVDEDHRDGEISWLEDSLESAHKEIDYLQAHVSSIERITDLMTELVNREKSRSHDMLSEIERLIDNHRHLYS